MLLCPRCDDARHLAEEVSPTVAPEVASNTCNRQVTRCRLCSQILVNPEPGIGNKTVLWQLTEGDAQFCHPFTYTRALVTVPGIVQPVTMNRRINQSVCDYIRHHFIPRDSDVWLVTYPKSGTTWVQNILSHLLFNESNTPTGIGVGLTNTENVVWFEAQCTNEKVKELILKSKSSEYDCTAEESSTMVDITDSTQANINYINNLYATDDSIDTTTIVSSVDKDNCDSTQQQSSPQSQKERRRRCFKSHSPLGILEPLLTSQGKIIHIARNPKDVSVSLWHHARSKDFGYSGDFSHFLAAMFSTGQVESGGWWEFVIPYWFASKRTQLCDDYISTNPYTNVLTLWYEDLIQNPEANVLKIAHFLELSNISLTRIAEIVSLCSFDTMKSMQSRGGVVLKERVISGNSECGNSHTPNANQIRKGGVGGWRDYYSNEQCSALQALHTAEVKRCCRQFSAYGLAHVLTTTSTAATKKDKDDGKNNDDMAALFCQDVKWEL